MFGKKCSRCGKKIKKSYDFCPFCSLNLVDKKQDERNYGFLGKEDVRTVEDDLFSGMPLPFRMMVKPLMKELNKQLGELGKELKKGTEENVVNSNKQPSKTSTFRIHFGVPGQRPIELKGVNRPTKKLEIKTTPEKVGKVLPNISLDDLRKANKLLKKEPETIVRRLSDSIVYEVKVPEVYSMNQVGIAKVATGFEIKAFSDKELFVKHVGLDLKLVDFYLSDGSLILEFDNSK